MRCPTCKKEVLESERDRAGSVYPFCSSRCQLIDLGRWLGEKYQIPVREDESEDSLPPPEDLDAERKR